MGPLTHPARSTPEPGVHPAPTAGSCLALSGLFSSCHLTAIWAMTSPLRKGNFLEGLLSYPLLPLKRGLILSLPASPRSPTPPESQPRGGTNPRCPFARGKRGERLPSIPPRCAWPVRGCLQYPRTRARKNHRFAFPVSSLALLPLLSPVSSD